MLVAAPRYVETDGLHWPGWSGWDVPDVSIVRREQRPTSWLGQGWSQSGRLKTEFWDKPCHQDSVVVVVVVVVVVGRLLICCAVADWGRLALPSHTEEGRGLRSSAVSQAASHHQSPASSSSPNTPTTNIQGNTVPHYHTTLLYHTVPLYHTTPYYSTTVMTNRVK